MPEFLDKVYGKQEEILLAEIREKEKSLSSEDHFDLELLRKRFFPNSFDPNSLDILLIRSSYYTWREETSSEDKSTDRFLKERSRRGDTTEWSF